MLQAVFRLLSLSLITISVILAGGMLIKWMAPATANPPLDHPLLKHKAVTIRRLNSSATPKAAESGFEWWAARVTSDAQRKWRVDANTTLTQVLEQRQNAEALLLDVDSRDTGALAKLVEDLKAARYAERVIFRSRYGSTLRVLRESLPRALYTLDSAGFTKLAFFSRLGLSGSFRIPADVVIAPIGTPPWAGGLSESAIQECLRQERFLVAEATTSDEPRPGWASALLLP